ncbi:MAG: hypothetical protein JO352_26455 [Chloroflexi bacterium]|nr:hypothetical protein [Chloroflexota bacterium]
MDASRDFLLQLRWTGRFGNRLLQYAYGATFARRTGFEYWLPSEWEGTRLFAHQPHPVVSNAEIRAAVAEPTEGSASNALRMDVVRKYFPEAEIFDAEVIRDPYAAPGHPVCHANGCAYNPAIFAGMSRAHLRSVCEFSDEVKRLPAYRRYSDLQGLYDVAHLRRDDISDAEYNRHHAQGYSVISRDAYFAAFEKFGYSADGIQWVSDDYTGKWHTNRRARYPAGWTYPTGSEYVKGMVFDWLDDFLKLYFARTIFRANSSFSWWAGVLSPTARVFSPVLDRRHIYGVDGLEEIDVEFVEGNHPHWLYAGDHANPDIVLGP